MIFIDIMNIIWYNLGVIWRNRQQKLLNHLWSMSLWQQKYFVVGQGIKIDNEVNNIYIVLFVVSLVIGNQTKNKYIL